MNETNHQTSQTKGMTTEELRHIKGTAPYVASKLARDAYQVRLAEIAEERAQLHRETRDKRRAAVTAMHALLTQKLSDFFGELPGCDITWQYEDDSVSGAELDFGRGNSRTPLVLSAVFLDTLRDGNAQIALQYEGLYLDDLAHLGEMMSTKEAA